jgi:hypothetical protein
MRSLAQTLLIFYFQPEPLFFIRRAFGIIDRKRKCSWNELMLQQQLESDHTYAQRISDAARDLDRFSIDVHTIFIDA